MTPGPIAPCNNNGSEATRGFQEHLPENVRLGGDDQLADPPLCRESSVLALLPLLSQEARDASLQSDTCQWVAKNPLKYAEVEALIFQELQALSRPGHKVSF
jgi:hypothetical protein